MFLIHSTDDGRVLPWEYYEPANGVTYKVGLALDEAMEIATAAPAYICMTNNNEEGKLIPVVRVQHDVIFETTASEAMSSVNIGDKVGITADGLEVNASASADGVAEVVFKEGDEVGDKVRVRF